MLQPFAGTHTWVLGVDGDEIYDPAGLAGFRAELARGDWDKWWVIFGNVLNCAELDETAKSAGGWLAPPCRSMTKLYNFAAIRCLDPNAKQRLMGRADVFQPEYHAGLRCELYKTTPWDKARFRCLHACFLPRSSAQKAGPRGRENLTELGRHSPAAWLRRGWARLHGRGAESIYKPEKYQRGPLVTVEAASFFP
jgi:hypothetical protein